MIAKTNAFSVFITFLKRTLRRDPLMPSFRHMSVAAATSKSKTLS